MPAKWFMCPDGEQIEISKCLKSCRLCYELPAGRCLSVRTLRLIAEQRIWNGTPSTTQLLKGTREAYLEIVEDYTIDPQQALFRVHGTKAHALLDQFTGDNELGEIRLTDDRCSGQFDFYDDGVLYDSKTWGSYKIMKALGMYQVEIDTGIVYKTGSKKGLPKIKKEWRDDGRKDRLDTAIQMNDYRMKLESAGFPVHTMIIEALCRDGNSYIAKSRGIEQNGFLIPINRISDRWISRYINAKAKALKTALETGEVPPLCRPRETWKNRTKCEKYCNVSEKCIEIERGFKYEYLRKVN